MDDFDTIKLILAMRFFTNEDGSYNFDCYRASIS